MLMSFFHDFRYAARRLRRSPAFTVASVLTFTIGIGATTTVFSVIYAVLFRPLPFPHADRLIQIVQLIEPPANAPNRERARAGLTEDQLLALQRSRTLSAVGRYAGAAGTITDIPLPVRLNGARVSATLFGALGVRPIVGRLFTINDEQPSVPPTILLSYRTWQRHFGGRSDIVDKSITVSQIRHHIIGVMPRDLDFPPLASASLSRNSEGELDDAPEFWLPGVPLRGNAKGGGFSLFVTFGVLRRGVTIEQARGEVATLLPPLPDNRRPPIELVNARVEMGRRVRSALGMFQVGVVLILLIACVNATNFFLARAAHRRSELVIRLTLGAGRAGVTRDAVAECLLLTGAGAAFGCLLAYALTHAVRVIAPHILPRAGDVRVDGVVLLFALALSVVLGVAVGAFSARRAIRACDPARLRFERGVNTAMHRGLKPSRGLVVIEIAATTILLVCSGLLIDSFVRVMSVDRGFQAEHVLTFRLILPQNRYKTTDTQEQFFASLASALRQLPSVRDAAAANVPLDSANVSFYPLTVDGVTYPDAGIAVRQITPGYLSVLGMQLRAGRDFTSADRTPTASRVIVNEAFARKYLHGGEPTGQHLAFAQWSALDVIGVAGDVRPTLRDEARPTLYLLADKDAGLRGLSVFVRTVDRPLRMIPEVRAAIRRLDPQLALFDPMSLEQMIQHSVASPRLFGIISLWCAVIALTLAVIGLAGLLAYSIGLRAPETAIRMALGANAVSILTDVVREGVVLTCVGVAVGGVGAYYASRYLEAMLVGVSAHDPVAFIGLLVLLLVVATFTCYAAAQRATIVDPMATFRSE